MNSRNWHGVAGRPQRVRIAAAVLRKICPDNFSGRSVRCAEVCRRLQFGQPLRRADVEPLSAMM
jgi:hypothetical protein